MRATAKWSKKLLSPNHVKNLWDIELGLIRGFPKFWKKICGFWLFFASFGALT